MSTDSVAENNKNILSSTPGGHLSQIRLSGLTSSCWQDRFLWRLSGTICILALVGSIWLPALWPLPRIQPTAIIRSPALWPQPSCFSLVRTLLTTIWSPGQPRLVSNLRNLNLLTSAKSFFPYKLHIHSFRGEGMSITGCSYSAQHRALFKNDPSARLMLGTCWSVCLSQ